MVTRAMMNDDDQDDDSADDNGDGAHREAAGDMIELTPRPRVPGMRLTSAHRLQLSPGQSHN